MSSMPRRENPIKGMMERLQQTIKNTTGKNMDNSEFNSVKLKLRATKSDNDRRKIISNTLEKYKRTPKRFRNNQDAAARTAGPKTAGPKRNRSNEESNSVARKRRKSPSNTNVNPKSELLNTLAKLRNK